MEKEKFAYPEKIEPKTPHGSAMKGYYPHELILGYEVCQMKGTHIGVSELTLEKSNWPFENSTTVCLVHKVKSKI